MNYFLKVSFHLSKVSKFNGFSIWKEKLLPNTRERMERGNNTSLWNTQEYLENYEKQEDCSLSCSNSNSDQSLFFEDSISLLFEFFFFLFSFIPQSGLLYVSLMILFLLFSFSFLSDLNLFITQNVIESWHIRS